MNAGHVDPESLVLSEIEVFLDIIQQAREEIAAGDTLSLDAIKQQFDRPEDVLPGTD